MNDYIVNKADEIIQSNQPLSLNFLDSTQHLIESEHKEIFIPIQCQLIPSMATNEQKSVETLQSTLILLPERFVPHKDHSNRSSIDSIKNGQSQKQWLNSLISKLSDDINETPNQIGKNSFF